MTTLVCHDTDGEPYGSEIQWFLPPGTCYSCCQHSTSLSTLSALSHPNGQLLLAISYAVVLPPPPPPPCSIGIEFVWNVYSFARVIRRGVSKTTQSAFSRVGRRGESSVFAELWVHTCTSRHSSANTALPARVVDVEPRT